MIERAVLLYTPGEVDARVAGSACVAIDVFRATSVIATAIDNGARRVIPVADPQAAFEVAATIGTDAILGGERHSVRIEGFALGNSPAEYTPEIVAGKTVVITTTNGTRAIAAILAHDPHPSLVCGALLNAGPAAFDVDTGESTSLVLVCGGTEGALSMEDVVGAGAIVAGLSGWAEGAIECGDAVRSAVALFAAYRENLFELLSRGEHAQSLIDKGFEKDVARCSRLDAVSVVPRWDGVGFVAG